MHDPESPLLVIPILHYLQTAPYVRATCPQILNICE